MGGLLKLVRVSISVDDTEMTLGIDTGDGEASQGLREAVPRDNRLL